jgi:acyl-CoA thioesterase-2
MSEPEIQTETLTETLQLERIEENLFRGTTPDASPGRIFGGQVIAQSLLAAYETVPERICHSLHCYFLRPGDPTVPIIFEVDRSRDGGSFTTRRVIAVQHGKQIFNLAASFQAPEKGFEHQAQMPAGPHWSELKDEAEIAKEVLRDGAPEPARRWMRRERPIELRSAHAPRHFREEPKELVSQSWMRCRTPIGDDAHMHQVIMAYASDMNLLVTALRRHSRDWHSRGFQIASLDHAMWFHKPTDFNQWHLYSHDSPSASGGRGFIRGSIYAEDGTLVASVAQEGLMRERQPK